MADGDNAVSCNVKGLLGRDGDQERSSYFFDEEVKRCKSEQYKVLGSQLAQKEKEAQISYEKNFADQINDKAQIDGVFVNLMLDSDASVNLDKLIGDLSSLAGDKTSGQAVTRLLDLLFVSRRQTVLAEELNLRKVHYDLYDPEAKGNFGSMETFYKLSSETGAQSIHSTLAMTLCMLETGQEAVVASALVHLANSLNYPWDALVLSRYYFGANSDVTRRVHNIWKEAVLKDDNFRMINIALSLNESNLKEVARNLMEGSSNKQTDASDQFNAYRCLAIALHNSSSLPEVERNLEAAEASRLMRAIYVTILGWGKLNWARRMLGDLSNRAAPGGIPSYICQICLTCHVDLVEFLMRARGIDSYTPSDGTLKQLGLKWRSNINRDNGDMNTLKASSPGSQKVVYDWILHLATFLRAPLLEESNLSKKMECVLAAFELLHELLQWAASGEENVPLRLVWPDHVSFTIQDESIVFADVIAGFRSRKSSIGSTRSAVTAKDDGKKQTKEERSSMNGNGSMSESRAEGNQHHKERSVNAGQESHDSRTMQTPSLMSRSNIPSISGTNFDRGSQQSKDWTRSHPSAPATSQDVRKYPNHSTSGHDHNAPRTPGTFSDLLASSETLIHGSPGGNHFCNSPGIQHHPIPQAPLSVSSSTSNHSIVDQSKNNQPLVGPHNAAPSTVATPSIVSPLKSPRVYTPDLTVEQIQAKLAESMKKNGLAADTKEVEQSISGQQPSVSLSSQHTIPPKPTMGTGAANEAHRRNPCDYAPPVTASERVPRRKNEPKEEEVEESIESESQSVQQPDQHFQELTKMMTGDDEDRMIAPDPSEMNKLFTGKTGEERQGQSTLPPGLLSEKTTSGETAPSTIMHSLLVPTFVDATSQSSSSSPSLIQLAPPDDVIVPPVGESTSSTLSQSDSFLTPITEASQETFATKSTALSESDATGLADELTDIVFEEDQTSPSEVRLDALSPLESSFIQTTPTLSQLNFNNSCNTLNRSDSKDEELRKQFTPTVSPLISSSVHNEASVTPSSATTTVESIASQTFGLKTEAEDADKLHHPILTEDPVVGVQSSEVAIEDNSTITNEIQQADECGHDTTQPPVFHPVMNVASVADNSEQQEQLPMVVPTIPNVLETTVMDGSEKCASTPFSQQQSVHQKETTTIPSEQQLSVDTSEQIVQGRVTSCGVPYTFSSSSKEEVGVDSAASKETVAENRTQPSPNMFDGFLSMLHTGVGVTQSGHTTDQSVSASNSMLTLPSEGASPMTDENDEHAAQSRQEASMRGELSPSIYSETYDSGSVPSVPSTAVTTPEPTFRETFNNGSIVSDNSEQSLSSQQNNQQYQAGDFAPQLPISESECWNLEGDSEQSQQQSTFPQMDQSLQSGRDSQVKSPLPTYVDPFAIQQTTTQPMVQQVVQQPPMNPSGAPCFGTFSGSQNAQQQGGVNEFPIQNHEFTIQNQGFNQDQRNHNQGNGNFNKGNSQGGRGERGSRGRGRGGGGRGGRGGGFGGGDGFSGNQENRGGNHQQSSQRGAYGQGGSGFGGGDNGQQKSNFGNQDARRGGGGGEAPKRGMPSGRGFAN